MDRTEIDLIRRAQKGDTAAFDRLMRRHDQMILRMIVSMVGNLHDACDVHQETFLRAYRRLPGFRFESELSTWLGRIAINLSINWRRRERLRHWLPLDGLTDPGAENDSTDDIDTNGNDSVVSRHIHEELKRLPHQQRVVFVLRHMNGLKLREIADMMGCAEGTVKNHLFRATHALRKKLKAFAPNP